METLVQYTCLSLVYPVPAEPVLWGPLSSHSKMAQQQRTQTSPFKGGGEVTCPRSLSSEEWDG